MKKVNRLVVEYPPADSGQVVAYHVNATLTELPETRFTFPLRKNRQLEKMGDKVSRLLHYFFENGAQSVRVLPRSVEIVIGLAYHPCDVCPGYEKMMGIESFDGAEFETVEKKGDGWTRPYFSPGVAQLDCDGIPSAIVAVGADGDPLVLLVSEDTYNAFYATMDMLGVSHVALANKLKRMVCHNGGQFHENAVMAALRRVG